MPSKIFNTLLTVIILAVSFQFSSCAYTVNKDAASNREYPVPEIKESESENVVGLLRKSLYQLRGSKEDYDLLISSIGDASIVLLGESTHGSHEFYTARAEITKRLIVEKNFNAVVIEADWPDVYRVNRYVLQKDEMTGLEALEGFKHYPLWMWRNMEFLEFISWLHDHNSGLPEKSGRTGIYGMDLYSLQVSLEILRDSANGNDSEAAKKITMLYECFEKFKMDLHKYGSSVADGSDLSCEQEAEENFNYLINNEILPVNADGQIRDELFNVRENARVIKGVEKYFRILYKEEKYSPDSWNLRDYHMFETINAVRQHIENKGNHAKLIVWAHNSHIGDARAKEASLRGQLNIGQLVREEFGNKSFLIGFTTYTGNVAASSFWGGPLEIKKLLPALSDSFELLFHETGTPDFLLLFSGKSELTDHLKTDRLQRAVGVVYKPETERADHYSYSRLADQFDAVIFFNETEAVRALDFTE